MFPGISSLTAIVSVSTLYQTLLHFLWQGTLITFAALLISRTFCRHSARRRYLVYTAALLSCPFCAVATLALGALSENSAVAATVFPSDLDNPTVTSLAAKAGDGISIIVTPICRSKLQRCRPCFPAIFERWHVAGFQHLHQCLVS